jgi:hypothetical protein
LVGINNDLDQIPTNQPAQPSQQIDPVEQASTYALLISIRMVATNAKRISETVQFATARQYVAHWWFNRQSLGGRFGNAPGIVYTWLLDPANYPPDREYPLAMLAEIGDAAITSSERSQLATSAADDALSEPTADEPAINWQLDEDLWSQVYAALELPTSTKQTWLSDARLLRHGCQFVLELDSSRIDNVQQRFRQIIRRTIATITEAQCSTIKLEFRRRV